MTEAEQKAAEEAAAKKAVDDAKKAADEATKKVADDAAKLAAEQKKANEELAAKRAAELAAKRVVKNAISLVGTLGGAFNIIGEGFGDQRGQVTIGGRVIEITSWKDGRLKGQLPTDLVMGEVVIEAAGVRFIGVKPKIRVEIL